MEMNINQLIFPKINLRNEELTKASWLLRFRWLTVAAQTLSVVFSATIGLIRLDQYPYFLFLIISLILFNTAATLWVKDRQTIDIKYIFFQLAFDIFQIGVFLYLLDFIKNPLIEILYLHLVLAIFVLPLRLNFLFYFLIVLMTSYFYHRTGTDHHNFHHFYSHLFTMTLLWIVLNWMISILTKFQATFLRIQDNKNRMDRLKSIGAMSSGICHELATPLGTISLKLNRLARKKEFNEDDINVALLAVKQCEQSIKFLSKSVASFDSEIESEINIKDFVSDLLKNYKDILFELKIDDELSVKANKVIFAQTLIDLVDNAIYFSKKEKIVISTILDEKNVSLEILNIGSQFSKIVMEKLGEPFLSVKDNGNGLGLFNAYNFMLSCNGSLTIENRSAETAVVTMRFPR